MAAEQLGYNAPDGMVMGSSATEKIAFYGATTIAQQTTNSAISTTASVSTSGNYGFASSTEAMQVVNAVSTMSYALRQLGLIA